MLKGQNSSSIVQCRGAQYSKQNCLGRMGRSGSVVPAVLEVTGRAAPSHLVSQRKSSMEGLSKGRLSCCSLTS